VISVKTSLLFCTKLSPPRYSFPKKTLFLHPINVQNNAAQHFHATEKTLKKSMFASDKVSLAAFNLVMN
jgi:hypothetical protein